MRLVQLLARRSFIHGRSKNYSTYERFEEALEEAKKCDQERLEALKDGVELPWLHGIPISVKDQFEVKGTLVTIGCGYLSE